MSNEIENIKKYYEDVISDIKRDAVNKRLFLESINSFIFNGYKVFFTNQEYSNRVYLVLIKSVDVKIDKFLVGNLVFDLPKDYVFSRKLYFGVGVSINSDGEPYFVSVYLFYKKRGKFIGFKSFHSGVGDRLGNFMYEGSSVCLGNLDISNYHFSLYGLEHLENDFLELFRIINVNSAMNYSIEFHNIDVYGYIIDFISNYCYNNGLCKKCYQSLSSCSCDICSNCGNNYDECECISCDNCGEYVDDYDDICNDEGFCNECCNCSVCVSCGSKSLEVCSNGHCSECCDCNELEGE